MVEHDRIAIPRGLLDYPTASLGATLDQWEHRFGRPHFAEEDMDAGVPGPAVAWCVRIGSIEAFIEHHFNMENTTLYVRGGDVRHFLKLVGLDGTPVAMFEHYRQ